MITIDDLKAIIAFLIKNNKPALIQAMNIIGNTVPVNISNDDLLQKVLDVFSTKGLDGIKNVLSRVPIIKATLTPNQKAFILKYSSAVKCGWSDPLACVQDGIDLIAGSSQVTTSTPSTTSVPALSSKTLTYIVAGALGIILILLIMFRKTLSVVKVPIIGIVTLVGLTVLYGTFAKTTVTTSGGSTTQQHGSIVNGILAAFGL